jgi:hypothetical protein
MATKTEIRHCTCEHTYQDTTYGKGNRVHNVTTHGIVTKAVCTVCGKKS